MRRATGVINDHEQEIRLGNISATGALVECKRPVAPGAQITVDIVGVGPVIGIVCWAGGGKLGVQFERQFDLTRLAPKKAKSNEVTMLRPWYVDRRETTRA